ncbi:MAG: M64 family metallopeptidase [Parabacteroides sp.]
MKKYWFICIYLLVVIISCSKEVDPEITMSSTSIEVSLSAAQSSIGAIGFSSATDWAVTCSDSWFTVSQTAGVGGTFNLTVTALSENDTYEMRKGTITITSGTIVKTVTVSQKYYEVIQLKTSAYTAKAEGDTVQVVFSTNINADSLRLYSSDAAWISLVDPNTTKGLESYYILIKVEPNTDNAARTAYIQFRNANSTIKSDVLSITQAGTVGTSTDFSQDGVVTTLQKASVGSGIPIIMMGDGFLDKDISDGTYTTVMKKAMENIFTEEPISSLRSYFSVYQVNAVSKNNSFESGNNTVFGCSFPDASTTEIDGNDQTVQTYAGKVSGVDVDNALVIVILNSKEYKGTTYFYADTKNYYQLGICYCPIIDGQESTSFRQVLNHEAIGHGFAKLEDEYSYEENGTIKASDKTMIQAAQKAASWYSNVDFITDSTAVLWSKFITDSRYSTQKIGIYEGAATYAKGAYRPTNESIMNANTGGFNAPSREAIYKRVMTLAFGSSWTYDYETFVTYDRAHPYSIKMQAATRSASFIPFVHPKLKFRYK